MGHFTKEVEEYQRDIDILTAYYRQMARALARQTGYSYEYCEQYVRDITGEQGALYFKDPRVEFVAKQKNQDRVFRQTTLSKFLSTIDRNDLIVSPSLAVYKNPKQQKSMSAVYVEQKKKQRSKAKKEMFKASQAGDEGLRVFKNNEQLSRKIKANSLSGAHCNASTILFYNTIHSTLTSMCRSATSYGNAHNERLIGGNRHYWSAEVAINNILAVIDNVDLKEFDYIQRKFNLHIPSVDEVVDLIERCSKYYWLNPSKMDSIRKLVHSLTDTERLAFTYAGDFYHLVYFNQEFGYQFLTDLSLRIEDIEHEPDPNILDQLSEEEGVLVSLICGPYMEGKPLAAFNDLDQRAQKIILATAENLISSLEKYKELIRAVFVNSALPSSIYQVPSIIRRCAITSDTDSTIYTVQDWIRWYQGQMKFDEASTRVGHVVSYLSSASIVHILAQMSKNLGVIDEHLFDYSMKSEFFFPVFSLTTRAKTYFASTGAQEGQIFDCPEEELEMKGPVFKGSNSPQFIVDEVHGLIERILKDTREEKPLRLKEFIDLVATREREIYDLIKQGSTGLYKKVEIKPAEAYKQEPYRSPHFHYLLWQDVFAQKYGAVENPPYEAYKVTLAINSKRDFRNYLQSLEDQNLASRFQYFMEKAARPELSMVQVPKPIADDIGVPKELIDFVDTRAMIANLMEPYYVLLESLGFYILDDNNVRLVSDLYQ